MTEPEWLSSADPRAMFAHVRDKISARKSRLFACACARNEWMSAPTEVREALQIAERYADGEVTNRELERAHRIVWRWNRSEWEKSGGSDGVHLTRDFQSSLDFIWATMPEREYHERLHENLGTPDQPALLREIVGNPFRLMNGVCGRFWVNNGGEPMPHKGCRDCRSILEWNGRTVPRLAQEIYDLRAWERLPILADALEEAGCTNEEILRHCRGKERCFICEVEVKNKKGISKLQMSAVEVQVVGQSQKQIYFPACLHCKGTGRRPLRAPHVRGCHVLDVLLGKE